MKFASGEEGKRVGNEWVGMSIVLEVCRLAKRAVRDNARAAENDAIFTENTGNELGAGLRDVCAVDFRRLHD